MSVEAGSAEQALLGAGGAGKGGGMRRLARHTAVYATADLIAKGGAYALIPILTRASTLGQSGLGTYQLVVAIVPVLTIVASLGLGGAVTRLWFDYGVQERKRFQLTSFVAMQATALSIAVLLTLLAGPLFGALYNGVASSVFVFGIWTSFFLAATTVPLAVLRAEEKPKRFAVLSSMQFLGPAAGVVVAVATHHGLHGVLWGHLLGSAAVFALSVAMMAPLSEWPPDWSSLRPALALGLPVVPHLVAHWALNVVDRVAIQRTFGGARGTAAVALYSVGYQIAQGVSLIATAFNNATVPTFYRAAQHDRRDGLGRAWAPILYVLGFFSLGVALFGREAVTLLAARPYRSSFVFIPWVALGYWLLAAYYFPVNALFYAKRIRWIPIATLVAAASNYALNIWLLPAHGLIAAAWNTAISYGILLVIVTIAAQRTYALPYRFGLAAAIGGTGAGVYALSTLLPYGAAGTALKVPLLGLYTAAGYALVRSDTKIVAKMRLRGAPDGDDDGDGGGDGTPCVALVAATATQARTAIAIAPALKARGFHVRFVSLDPVHHKSATAGFGAVAHERIGSGGGLASLVFKGRADARRVAGDCAAVVLGNDFTPFERLVIEQAHANGRKVVLLQDGVIALDGEQAGGGARSGSTVVTAGKRALSALGFPFAPKAYGLGGCDLLCVYGPSTRDALVARGVPPATVAVTGQPRYDAIAPGSSREIALVTTQPFSRYRIAGLTEETETFAAMIEAATGSGLPVVVKLHPDTGAASAAALQERFASRASFEATAPIETLFARAAVLVTLSSTTALEAMLHGVGVVVLDVGGFPATLPYAASGAVVAARAVEALPAAIAEALRPSRERDAAVAEFLSRHLAPGDGAAARVADAIATLVDVENSLRDSARA